MTIKTAIAESMLGITTDNILNFVATADTTISDAIYLTYIVETVSVYTSTELIDQFKNSALSGEFNTYLQAAAADSDATYLLDATNQQLILFTLNPTRMPTASPTTAYPTTSMNNPVKFNGKQVDLISLF